MPRSERDESAWFFLVCGFVLGAAALRACEAMEPEAAAAQDAPRVTLAPYLVLARIGVKEESLFPRRSETSDEQRAHVRDGMSLIHDVLTRGAARTHTSYQRFAEQYSRDAFVASADRPWIADLRVGTWRPAGWPTTLLWLDAPHTGRALNGYDLWMRVVADAVARVKGTEPDACPVPADHWGGPMDHERGLAEGWVWEPCGTSRNEGWLVPAWHTAEELARAVASRPRAVVAAGVARGRGGRR